MNKGSVPYLYISAGGIQGGGHGGWSCELNGRDALPAAGEILEAAATQPIEADRLVVLVADDLLHPLRIQLDQKVAKSDLKSFLLWKLKRYLPYPIEQVELRFVPLQEPGNYLTFSLPRPWLARLFEGLEQRGVHAGYVGGLFSFLLENRKGFRNRLCLGLFRDFYLLAELDGRGNYLRFRTRRLPFTAEGTLDRQTWLTSDLEPLLRQQGKPLLMLNFAQELDGDCRHLSADLRRLSPELVLAPLQGATLARFEACMRDEVAP